MSKSESSVIGTKLIAKNRQAQHNYEILETLECGLVLTGTEVKSLRVGQVSFADSFAQIKNGELFLFNLTISEYSMGNRFNHITTRRRKVLAHKSEIRKLKVSSEQRGLTLVPLSLHWRRGLAKVTIALVRGKKLFDKRESIKKREQVRDQQRIMRSYSRS